jgi:hypothetical protein
VRHTINSIGRTWRRTIVYLLFTSGALEGDTFCVSASYDLKNVRQAKKLINKILDDGKYYYGMPF